MTTVARANWQILLIPALCLVAFIVLTLIGKPLAGLMLTLAFLALGISFRAYPKLKGFAFTMTIFAAFIVAMYYPQYFKQVGGFKLSTLIIPLLQVIMFGMGAELSFKELAGIIKMPKGILVGVVCHYTFMPLIGFGLANLFHFPNEIAAGIILVGCCPSGLASNVMAYLARANLALSVAVTTVSTLLAPLFTPLLMRLLAGKFIEVHFLDMALDTTRVVLIPIFAGLLFDKLVRGRLKWLDKLMPVISMAGIALIIVVITAAGRDSLLKVGFLLFIAVFIHNVLGYTLGYWFGRLLRFKEKDCRTISLEVGMQNSGLAAGLALLMGGMGTVGLAAVIFGPVMNISGSSLSNWWHGRPPKAENENRESVPVTVFGK